MITVLPNARLIGGPLDGDYLRNKEPIEVAPGQNLVACWRTEGSPAVAVWAMEGPYGGATRAAYYRAPLAWERDWVSFLYFVRSVEL